MAVRSLLLTLAASGDEEGNVYEEKKADLLVEKLTSLGGSSLLSLRLLFDCEGDELIKEARELASSLGVPETAGLLPSVAQCLVETPLSELSDTLEASVKPLRKRKLVYGRMVIDFESESSSAHAPKQGRLSVFPPAPLVSRIRQPSDRNMKVAEAAASRILGSAPSSARSGVQPSSVSLQSKEALLRSMVVPLCFDLLEAHWRCLSEIFDSLWTSG